MPILFSVEAEQEVQKGKNEIGKVVLSKLLVLLGIQKQMVKRPDAKEFKVDSRSNNCV